jgi:hypothetical protein
MLQLIKDSCGTKKFPKQAATSFYKKDNYQIEGPQVEGK